MLSGVRVIKSVKSELATMRKRAMADAEKGKTDTESAKKYISALDKAAKKGVLKKNTTARRKSQLYRLAAR